MAVPGLSAEIIVQGNAGAQGSNPVNTAFIFHFIRDQTIQVLNKAFLDSAFQTAITPSLLAALNNTWSQVGNSVRWIDDATDAPVLFPHVAVGGVAGDAMPKNNAVYTLIRSGLRGKNYRGSKHFGPISEADTTAGTADILNAAAITRFQALTTAMATSFLDGAGNRWTISVFSRTLSQSRVNPTNIVNTIGTSVNLNKRIGRMRRREPKSVY